MERFPTLCLCLRWILFILCLAGHPRLSLAVNVLCTTPTIQDMANVLGGNMVKTILLDSEALPASGSKNTQKLQKADLVFSNGLSYDFWLEKVLKRVDDAATKNIILSENIHPLTYSSSSYKQNPYAWLDPQNGMAYAHQIKEAFLLSDPERADNYMFNYQLYLFQLSELDSFVRKRIQAIPETQRILPRSLEAFQYFAERYGITFVDTIMPSVNFPKDALALEVSKDSAAIANTYIDLVKHNTLILAEAMENKLWRAKKKASLLSRSLVRNIFFLFLFLVGATALIYLLKKYGRVWLRP